MVPFLAMATDMPTSPCAALSFSTKPSTTDPRLDEGGVGSAGQDCAEGVLPPPQATKPHAIKRKITAEKAFRATVLSKIVKGNAYI
jgi:hypothetical protein